MRKRPYNGDMATMTAPTLLKRLSRPENPPSSFRITQRDVEIVRAVARFGYLTSEQIIRYLIVLFGPMSHQQVLRRLHILFDSHYLNRPEHQHLQLSSFSHFVYGLGREGAHLLARLGDPVDPRLQWAAKNSASATHLMHTLETAQTMLEFERACRSTANLQLLDHAALLPHVPDATRELDHPFRLRVTTQHDFKKVAINVVPDRVFSIVLAAEQRHNFCLELDRGTMSVAARRITSKSNYARKILGYYEGWKQQRHRDQWGFQGFRVLTITPSETRIANMIDAQRDITGNRVAALFLYSTPERIAAKGALGDVWMSSEADGISLLDRK